ncbi:helix-turn-helix domain-containing protein [Streptomyces youssoufiensis]
MSEEEVQRVTEALDAIERIEDPEARARAMSRVMVDQAKRTAAWKAERRELVLSLRRDKVPYRTIAARLGVSLGTVQDIERGYSGSGRNRPRKGEEG